MRVNISVLSWVEILTRVNKHQCWFMVVCKQSTLTHDHTPHISDERATRYSRKRARMSICRAIVRRSGLLAPCPRAGACTAASYKTRRRCVLNVKHDRQSWAKGRS